MSINMFVIINKCVYIYIYICIHTQCIAKCCAQGDARQSAARTYMHIYIYICIETDIYIYIYIERERDIYTHTHNNNDENTDNNNNNNSDARCAPRSAARARFSGISRMRFVHSSNRGMCQQYPLTVLLESPKCGTQSTSRLACAAARCIAAAGSHTTSLQC